MIGIQSACTLAFMGVAAHAFLSPCGRGQHAPTNTRLGAFKLGRNVSEPQEIVKLSPETFAINTEGMPNLIELSSIGEGGEGSNQVEEGASTSKKRLVDTLLPLVGIGAIAFGAKFMGFPGALPSLIQSFQADPTGAIQSIFAGTDGPTSIVYFGVLYVIAELIAIPSTPLTLSAGYLFGVTNGTLVVSLAGIVSSIIGFFIGRLYLRQRVEGVLDDKPIFRKLDNAIGTEGLKMLVLARLTPIFPFCLLNYFYGASSIPFPTFVLGTLLGFIPTTIIYTYTGLVGKELLFGGGGGQPWYIYVGSVTVLLAFLKLVTDVATNLIEAVREPDE